MRQGFRILFEDDLPLEPRCIKRFIRSFSKSYRDVIGIIIQNSQNLEEKTFKSNVATLMPPFKMTRAGAFRGVKIDEHGVIHDPNRVVDLCWKRIKEGLQKVKEYADENVFAARSRVLANLSPESKEYIIRNTSELYEKLLQVRVITGEVTPVAASKVLFATLPEFALPVDNLEWNRVFEVKKKYRQQSKGYAEILSRMISEIDEWENLSHTNLETLDSHPTTLPAVYNVLAMSARPF